MNVTKSDLLKFISTYRGIFSFIELVYDKTFSKSEYVTCAVYTQARFPDSDLIVFRDVLTCEEVYLPVSLRLDETH